MTNIRIHWNDGKISLPMNEEAACTIAQYSMDKLLWMEDMDMKPFLDKCIMALKGGITLGTDGLFIQHIEDDNYIVVDPALGNEDGEYDNEVSVRRRLQTYYKASPMEYEMDKEYIEELYGELA